MAGHRRCCVCCAPLVRVRTPPTPAAAADAASPPASSAPAGEPVAASPTEPPAESGLSIKRGVMMLAQDRTTFRPCDEQVELWVLDQTDGVLARTFAGDASNAPTMLYVEAYGERAPVDEEISAGACVRRIVRSRRGAVRRLAAIR